LQILAKRIIVDAHGEILDYQLNSPFVYLRSLVQNLSTPGNGEGDSEQISEGASIFLKPPTDDVERFLFLLRVDSRGKANTVGCYAHVTTSKTGI
jgi:hypothetical protein